MNEVSRFTFYAMKKEWDTLVRSLNKVVKPYLDEHFLRYKSDKAKQLWRKKPFRAIIATDEQESKYKTKINPDSKSHVALNILLNLRGENYMEQEINNLAQNKFPNSDALESINNAALKERAARIRLVEEAEKCGWTELTLKELQFNEEEAYHKIMHDFNKRVDEKGEVGKGELELANFMRGIKKDKVDMMKFLMTHKLREQQLKIAEKQAREGKKEEKVIDANEVLA